MKTTIWVKVRFIQENDIPITIDNLADVTVEQENAEAIRAIVTRPPEQRLGSNPVLKWDYKVAKRLPR